MFLMVIVAVVDLNHQCSFNDCTGKNRNVHNQQKNVGIYSMVNIGLTNC